MYGTISTSTPVGSGGGNSVTTAAVDTTGADIMVVVAAYAAGTNPTLSDSKSNTWTGLTAQVSATHENRLFYCGGGTVGTSHTFTLSATASNPAIAVLWVAGSAPTPFDQENGNTAASASSVTTGSITPTQPYELLVSGLTHGTAANTPSMSGWTSAFSAPSATARGLGIAYLLQTSPASSVNPTWTMGAGLANLAATIASFKAFPTGPLVSGRHRKLVGGGIIMGGRLLGG